jgi:hypothetical protein
VRDTRTVKQDVDAPELFDGAPDDFLDLRFFGDVELEWESAPAERSNLSCQLFCLTRVFIDQDAICALASTSIYIYIYIYKNLSSNSRGCEQSGKAIFGEKNQANPRTIA